MKKLIELTDENGLCLVSVEHIAAIRREPKDAQGSVLVMGNRSGRLHVNESLETVRDRIAELGA